METFSNSGGAIPGYFPEEFTPIETEQLKRLDLGAGNPGLWGIWGNG
jgi:hypothetical protein